MFANTKKSRWLLLLVVLAMGVFALSGCSDDDDDPAGPTGSQTPEFNVGANQQVDAPTGLTNSNDPKAQMVTGFMNQANALVNMGSTFNIPAGAVQTKDYGDSWEYTWSVNDPPVVMSVRLVIEEFVDFYSWTLYFDGTDGDAIYDNVIVYYAEAAMDGSWGMFRFYDLEGDPGDVIFSWDWMTSTDGIFTLTMIAGSSSDLAKDNSMKIVFVVNPDGSGTLDIYDWVAAAWQILWHFQWDSVGNGSWIQYQDGMMIEEDSWVAETTG